MKCRFLVFLAAYTLVSCAHQQVLRNPTSMTAVALLATSMATSMAETPTGHCLKVTDGIVGPKGIAAQIPDEWIIEYSRFSPLQLAPIYLIASQSQTKRKNVELFLGYLNASYVDPNVVDWPRVVDAAESISKTDDHLIEHEIAERIDHLERTQGAYRATVKAASTLVELDTGLMSSLDSVLTSPKLNQLQSELEYVYTFKRPNPQITEPQTLIFAPEVVKFLQTTNEGGGGGKKWLSAILQGIARAEGQSGIKGLRGGVGLDPYTLQPYQWEVKVTGQAITSRIFVNRTGNTWRFVEVAKVH
jgi:hypothetical protein